MKETINAPLPGTVLEIKVTEGQQVSAGDVIVVLEAMKMENELSATSDGIVKKISVASGDVVQLGTDLVEIE